MTSFQKTSKQALRPGFEQGIRPQQLNAASDTVFSDGIVCLIDGQKRRNLRKWLVLQYGMSPTEYRNLYGLPDDYPMAIDEKQSTPRVKTVTSSKPKLIATPRAA